MHRASLSSTLCVHFSSTIVDAASDDVVGCPETAAASGRFDGRAREVGERVLAAEIRRGGHGRAVIGSAYARGVGPTHSSMHPVNRWFGGGEVPNAGGEYRRRW
jgi:hypothetical protein